MSAQLGATPYEPLEVQAAQRRIGLVAFGKLYYVQKVSTLILIVAAPVAFVGGLLRNDRLEGVGFGLIVLVLGLGYVWLPFLNRQFRMAMELYNDHNCHERAEWQREMGSKMPTSLKGAEQWLVEHPTGRGRSSMLLALGRVSEFDEALANYSPDTPERSFDVEVARETRNLYMGEEPDVARLHSSWRALPNARERRHRRECLAILDAQIAAARGKDAIAVMAHARAELDSVYWRYRSGRYLAVLFLAGAMLVVFAGLLGGSIGLIGLS